MKVICINAGDMPSGAFCPDDCNPFDIKEGEVYTVVNSFIANGYCWYVLDEDPYKYSEDTEWGFDSLRFESLTHTDAAIEEAVRVIELTPIQSKRKNWFQKLFS